MFYLYPHLYSRFNFNNYPNFFFAGYINLHFDSFWKFSLWNSFSVINNWRYLYCLILSSSFRSWDLLIALITDDVIFLSALVIFSVNSLGQSSVDRLHKLFVLSSWIYRLTSVLFPLHPSTFLFEKVVLFFWYQYCVS